MKRSITRVVLILLGIVVVLAVVAGIGGLTVVRRPFPQTAGTLEIPGLQDEVRVYRDEYGIPHIYAQNEADLFLAQGYVHAQDRFWQMEFWRHIGQGRVSEITGAAGVSSDKYIRTFGWNRIAEDIVAYYQAEAPEFYAVLEAYSAGVNAYIAENEDQLAMQITVLGLVQEPWQIEPWTPVNTVSWGVVMSDDLATNWDNEIGRLKRMQRLGETERAALTPGYPYDDRPVIVTAEELVEGNRRETAVAFPAGVNWNQISTRLIGSPPPDYVGFGDGPFIGSNNWVASGEHTASGLPLLANDPHLGVQMPSIWYEVGLHAPSLNVVGFSFAGVPGVIIGHTEKIAWGVTTSAPDVQDLYIERLNPENPNQYEYMGEWHDMEIVEEVIKVNGGEDVTLPVRITRHGPIVTEQITGEEDQISDVLSVRWTAFDPSRILQSVVLLNRAQNHDDFLEAMRYWDVPSQSVVYADVEGNIAYFMSGRVPIRKNGDGAMPAPGWTDEYEWEGWIPHEELPATLNPEKGFIVTANNAVVDDAYPYHLAYDYSTGDRAQRIVNVLQTAIAHGDKFTVDDFTRLQMDNKSLPARAFGPLLARIESDDPQMREALDYLLAWDLQEDADSVAAALWEITFLHLVENALQDEVGVDNLGLTDQTAVMYDLAANPEATWWDDTTTPETETAVTILERSLQDAIVWFEENQGGEMADWTWGKIHTINFEDGVLGQSGIGLLESTVNRGPFPVGGSSSIVNANSWSRSNPAVVRGHPSMRMVVDMSDLASSQAIHPTGQSGHPYHPHYDDMIPLWLAGEYHPMRWERGAVEETAVDTLILQPAR